MATVELSAEQELLAELAADLGAKSTSGDPGEHWATLTTLGLLDLTAEGGGTVELGLVVERFAAALSPLPYLGMTLGGLLEPGCTIALAADLLGPGGAVAWDAAKAADAVWFAGGGKLRAPLGPATTSADLTRRLTWVGTPAGAGELTAAAADRWTARALALLSADLLGVMEGTLEAATDHARTREQFGRPIGSFQAVQHLLADQAVSVEASRSVVRHALWAADVLAADAAVQAGRVAKAWTSARAVEVCEAAIQVWGGMGMTWECSAHVYLRRALMSRAVLGDEAHQLAQLATSRLGAAA